MSCYQGVGLELAMYSRRVSNSDPPAYPSPLLGLQACITMPDLCGVGDRTQGFVHTEETVYELHESLSLRKHFVGQ